MASAPSSFYMKGQTQFFKDMERMQKVTQEKLRELIVATAGKVANRARAFAPNDTGVLRGSLATQVIEETSGRAAGRVAARVYSLPFHGLPAEFGYKGKSGKGNSRHHLPIERVGGKWQVIKPLREWAERHGKPPWAVAKKLLKKGRPAHPFLVGSLETYREAFLSAAKKIVESDAPQAGASSGAGA